MNKIEMSGDLLVRSSLQKDADIALGRLDKALKEGLPRVHCLTSQPEQLANLLRQKHSLKATPGYLKIENRYDLGPVPAFEDSYITRKGTTPAVRIEPVAPGSRLEPSLCSALFYKCFPLRTVKTELSQDRLPNRAELEKQLV